MKRTRSLGQALVSSVLLSALSATPGAVFIDTVELELDRRVTWTETSKILRPRCFTVQMDEPGILGVAVTTTAPSTPDVLVLAFEDGGPELIERTETILVRLSAGEHLVCLTTQMLGHVEIAMSFVAEVVTAKIDEDETELEPDPQP